MLKNTNLDIVLLLTNEIRYIANLSQFHDPFNQMIKTQILDSRTLRCKFEYQSAYEYATELRLDEIVIIFDMKNIKKHEPTTSSSSIYENIIESPTTKFSSLEKIE